ncbi:MAG TPA: hypothetical protein VGI70_07055 [Polyangiales bacterium]|jgi:hypothetical protein
MSASGLSLRAFAAREGLNPHTLWSWKAKLRSVTPTPPSFVAVTVQPPREEPIEIVLPSGVTLRVAAHFDETTLTRVVRALSESGR